MYADEEDTAYSTLSPGTVFTFMYICFVYCSYCDDHVICTCTIHVQCIYVHRAAFRGE